jgi:hypothetical protein
MRRLRPLRITWADQPRHVETLLTTNSFAISGGAAVTSPLQLGDQAYLLELRYRAQDPPDQIGRLAKK